MARIDNLQNFIEDVGQAIKEKKGIPAEQKIQVRDFDTEIMSIETGGGTPGETSTFEEIYNATRPNDWLQFPSDENVLDNEIYMLINIPNTDETLFTFRSVFTGEAFIDTGDGNVFPLTSGTKFEYAYDFNQVSGVVNSEGHKQVIVKVYGGVFTTIDFYQPHSRKSSSYQQSIVDIKMRASLCSSLRVSSSSVTNEVNRKLKYFNFLGVNNVTYMHNTFFYCYSLTTLNIDTSKVTNMRQTFQSCYSLTALNIDTSNVTDMQDTFNGCYSLTSLNLDTSSVTNMSGTFNGCYSLTSLNIDTSNVTYMSSTFKNCYSLTSLSQLDMSKVTNVGSGTYNATFNNNNSLADFSILSSLGEPTTVLTFYLQKTNLSRNKLVELATNLPATTVNKTININGTLGTKDLTEDDKAIFIDKGYILVV